MLKEKIVSKLKSQKVKNFIIYGFGQAVNLISPLLVIPYLVSTCGEEGLGKIGVGFSLALIAIVLVDYGSYINGTKEISINIDNNQILEEKFTTIYIAKLIVTVVVLLITIIALKTIPFLSRDFLQLFFSFLIVIGQLVNPTWFFQGLQNFKWISIINVTSKVIYLILVFSFIKKPEDYIFVNAFFGLGLLVSSIFGFIWIYNRHSFSFKKGVFKKSLLLLKSESSLTISQLFFSLYQYAPILLISYIGGDFMAGQYRIIDQIVMVFRTYFQMFFNFSYADVCLNIYENKIIGINIWLKYNGYNYFLVLFLLICFGIFSTEILYYFKVAVTDNMISLFIIGLFIPVFMGISFSLKQLMFSFNENKSYIAITITATIFSLLLMFWLINKMGLRGAFVATIIIEILISTAYIFILRPHIFIKQKKEH
jgi:O-antigen/teichoic acid export membrane protein